MLLGTRRTKARNYAHIWAHKRQNACRFLFRCTSATITASIAVDCVAHLGAATLFEALVLKGNAHFTSLAGFITSNYSQSYTVSGDKEEVHHFTMEVVKGVFRECHKFRCRRAADRTAINYSMVDAGRSLCWAALQTMQLLNEMVLMRFTGHPLLSPYTVSHLYRHRVARRELTTIDTKVQKLETEVRATDALAKKLKQKVGV
jgi:hypothetical protein